MSQNREPLPLIEIASVIIGPMLVMLMVGSLVFFLIEVIYGAGLYEDRLLYTFFFFVMGSVLIARIHIRMGRGKAALYSGGLGIATFIALQAFVSYPGAIMSALAPVFNIILMVIVWWSANKLTWDCTHLEEGRKASGKGILAAAGMDDSANDPDRSEEWQAKEKKKKGKRDPGKLISWWERYQAYLDWKQKRPHTPGVWILYFALAAIPIFGLGQSLIPTNEPDRRHDAFLLAAVYVGSAMGLLVTTTLMGLQRYLKARGATISAPLTLGWLGTGGVLVLIFLACGAVLPRPHAETSIGKLRGKDQKRDASRNAAVRDKSTGEGEGKEGKGEQSNEKGKDGKPKSGGDEPDENGSGGKKKSDDGEQDKDGDNSKRSQQQSSSQISQAMEGVSNLLKWLVWVILAILIIGFLVFGGLKWLAPFTSWARGLLDWWRSLFETKKKPTKISTRVIEEVAVAEYRPGFDQFSNPFTSGEASRRSDAELVRYTYKAFEAWAWDRAQGREENETANEFARRVGEEFPDVSESAIAVADLMTSVTYSEEQIPAHCRKSLEECWVELTG